MNKLSWQAVIVIVAVLAAITTLALFHADTTVILTAVGLLGLGGGVGAIYGTVSAVKDQTNGNTTKLHELVEKLTDRLAESTPMTVTRSADPADELDPAAEQVTQQH